MCCLNERKLYISYLKLYSAILKKLQKNCIPKSHTGLLASSPGVSFSRILSWKHYKTSDILLFAYSGKLHQTYLTRKEIVDLVKCVSKCIDLKCKNIIVRTWMYLQDKKVIKFPYLYTIFFFKNISYGKKYFQKTEYAI